jgi:hypothetical protein
LPNSNVTHISLFNKYNERMKNYPPKPVMLASFIVLVLVLSTGAIFAHSHQQFTYQTNLRGADLAPPVNTITTGNAKITINASKTEANFEVHLNNGIAVNQAKLHCGRPGSNGPTIIHLFGGLQGGCTVNGRLAGHTFRGEHLEAVTGCPTPINNISDLQRAMERGEVYLTVSSILYPNGVVRGHFSPTPSPVQLLLPRSQQTQPTGTVATGTIEEGPATTTATASPATITPERISSESLRSLSGLLQSLFRILSPSTSN